MDRGDEDPAAAACELAFLVGAEPPVTHKPGEGALHDPALGQHREGALSLHLGHDHKLKSVLLQGD